MQLINNCDWNLNTCIDEVKGAKISTPKWPEKNTDCINGNGETKTAEHLKIK